MDQSEDQKYEMVFRVLGNEIFAISLSTTSTSNRWIVIALVSMFSAMTVLGAYGDKFVALYHSLVG